jgi:hypothetical protein
MPSPLPSPSAPEPAPANPSAPPPPPSRNHSSDSAPGAPRPLGLAQRGRKSIQAFASRSLPRIVGYGLLALLALDLLQLAVAYRPFQPEADANLVVQILERIAVPLLAYALIFSGETLNPSRYERIVQKLLSIGSLVWMLLCLGLAALAVSSGFRLYNRAALVYQQQTAEQSAALVRLRDQAPTLAGPQLQVTFNELVRRAQGLPTIDNLPPEEMRRQIVAAIPGAIDTTARIGNEARRRARLQQILITGKYFLGGIISAVLFLMIWEATVAVRSWRMFHHRHAPSLAAEDRMVSGLRRLMARVSDFSPFPPLNDYRWYRHLRRAWQHRRAKW